MTFKVIIAGSRTFRNHRIVRQYCDKYLQNKTDIEIVSGGADGVDKLGERYAKEHSHKLTIMNAAWKQYGKSAGPIRNRQMAEYADAAIVFWDQASKGSKNMIDTAREKGLLVRVVDVSKY
jgi:predicted Rossmann fold nucleotide-binding protein DprA/Smf involved in DNA uptake